MEKGKPRVGHTPAKPQVGLACARFLVALGVWGGLLFAAAGDFAWGRGWFQLSLWIVTLATNFAIILWMNPAGLATRMKRPRIGEKFDKVIVSGLIPGTLAIPVLAGLARSLLRGTGSRRARRSGGIGAARARVNYLISRR